MRGTIYIAARVLEDGKKDDAENEIKEETIPIIDIVLINLNLPSNLSFSLSENSKTIGKIKYIIKQRTEVIIEKKEKVANIEIKLSATPIKYISDGVIIEYLPNKIKKYKK